MMIGVALVGVGKIARDQHVPAIERSDAFVLSATASPDGGLPGVSAYPDLDALIAAGTGVEAVAICTPPAVRFGLACRAIEGGLHVLLEKPPAATLGEIAVLRAAAAARGVSLFAAWHSREAAGVAPARAWLAGRTVRGGRLTWREDIRRWHPGQDWILAAGGYGVFDPGINALSILSAILPDPILVREARMEVPAGRGAPIAASLALVSGGATIACDLDFRQTGPQTWSMEIDTDDGTLTLDEGGRVIRLPGGSAQPGEDAEYAKLYARFATLIAQGGCDADDTPQRLVADAFLIAEFVATDAFAFDD